MPAQVQRMVTTEVAGLAAADLIERDPTLPPHNRNAEEAVLGAVLKRPTVMASLLHLGPEDFYDAKYRAIWRAMLDLWNRNVPIDYTTIDARLRVRDLSTASVGVLDLATINLSVSSASNVAHYAQLVIDAATQRRIISASQRIAEMAWRPGADVDQLARESEAILTAARPARSSHDLVDPETWARAFWDDLNGRTEGQRTAVTTGLVDLDAMTLGLEAGGLYLLTAIPGTGKTELALQIAMHVAERHGPVLFASLEMSAVELAHRFARIKFGMDRNHLAKGQLSDAEHGLALQAMNAITSTGLWPATPTKRYTTADLRADAMEVQSRAGHVALVVADYVQRFRDQVNGSSSPEENIASIVQNLKSLARELGCPVLAPVQPNREYIRRVSDPRPKLGDLRGSGALEQEADVVLGLYRDEKHNPSTQDRGLAELHMLKNRSSVGDSDGMRRLAWLGHRYGNHEPQQRSPLP